MSNIQTEKKFFDGKTASSYIAYAFSDIIFIYSVTIGTEYILNLSIDGTKNIFGNNIKFIKLETKNGAGGALHGALAGGVSASILTSAESIPFMISSIIKIAHNRLPAVIHVQTNSMDHSSLLSCLESRAILISSNSVQEIHDLAIASHLIAFAIKTPVIHFFNDSEKVQISVSNYSQLSLIAEEEKITSDIFEKLLRPYSLFDYIGNKKAEIIFIMLSAGSHSVEEAVLKTDKLIGLIKVRLYRPWSSFHLLSIIPNTVKKIIVIDQIPSTLELTPLFHDVSATLLTSSFNNIKLISGTLLYGLKEILPSMIYKIIESNKNKFILGEEFTTEKKHNFIIYHQTSKLNMLKNSSILLLNSQWTSVEDLENNLSFSIKKEIASKNLFFVVDVFSLAQKLGFDPNKQQIINFILHIIFLKLSGLEKEFLFYSNNILEDAIKQIIIPSSWHNISIQKWHHAAWSIMFPEAFSTEKRFRPDINNSFLITVTKNKRLTPKEYDRNVFHLEFDIEGTGLKYEIGDALSVHGHNDEKQVNEFLLFYGIYNFKDLIIFKNKNTRLIEQRTIEQIFIQYIDIFGRPSKRFYMKLALYAKEKEQKEKLEFLVSAEGSSEFKQRVSDTITYADILKEFDSAHPSISELIEMIDPIKPRHYSISSSIKMHPNSVHLLVVLVDWTTSKGTRVGQCTSYLSNLKPGNKVVVSVKPSVMKLPPLDIQPVIMAGLGTGMAPFRAFIEERAVLKKEERKIGPMILYFGARHRAMEYLYEEELEAYHQEGIVTYLRLAFSRDQKEKIYIQNKITEDAEIIHEYLLQKNGHFYLCGPTWPVTDVRDAIVSSFTKIAGLSHEHAIATINQLKKQEKYILEVY